MTRASVLDKIKSSKWLLLLAALCVIPYFAFQNMKTRKNAHAYPLSDRVDVRLSLDSGSGSVVYLDGTKLPADAMGIACLTLPEFQKAPDKLGPVGKSLKEADFPIVIFFNSTGFDSTGTPIIIRSAADGHSVWKNPHALQRIQYAVPHGDGSFTVYFSPDDVQEISATEWPRYMGLEPPPAQAELEKMSDEELAKIGYRRLPKDKPEEKSKEKEEPKETVAAPSAKQSKTGVRGMILRVGGIPAVSPLPNVQINVYKGKVKPTGAPKDPALLTTTRSDAAGAFAIALEPGEYTLAVVIAGRILSNALNQSAWPSVKITDGWKEYEFRVPAL